MISDHQILVAATAYARQGAGEAIVGTQSAKGQLPSYVAKSGIPAICALAAANGKVGAVCKDFYSKLHPRTGRVTCPWGVQLQYSRIDSPSGVYGIFLQSGFTAHPPESDRIREIRDQPRREKKALKDAVQLSARTSFHSPKDRDLLSSFETLLSTLLTGRTADAIRTVAHEIQSPVQGAISDTTILKQLADRGELPVSIHSRVQRLARNLDAVAAYSRRIPLLVVTDLEYNPAQLRRVVLTRAIENVAARLESFAESRGIEVRRNHKVQLEVEAVPDQLEMVLHNLVHNAIKYSFKKTDGQAQYVQIRAEHELGAAIIMVENVGPPITPEEIANGKIFQLGYRGRYSNDRGRQGTGSGMYIAHRIVKGHGGSISIECRQLVEHPDTPASKVRMLVRWPLRALLAGADR